MAEDKTFRQEWAAMKRVNKGVLADRVMKLHGIDLDPDTMFDCQVKRFHEYKRQLMNAMHALALHERLRANPSDFVPRTVIFAGKAAPGYGMAKLCIQLIHAVAKRIADDPMTRGRLSVAFLPNYSVSLAEVIFPACDLSEQISTAGTEASGTGNMKAALNGALTFGTLDGANVEIREEVGAENIFIFGHTKDEIEGLATSGYSPHSFIRECEELRRSIDIVSSGARASSVPSSMHSLARTAISSAPTSPPTPSASAGPPPCIRVRTSGGGCPSSTWPAWESSPQTGPRSSTPMRSGAHAPFP